MIQCKNPYVITLTNNTSEDVTDVDVGDAFTNRITVTQGRGFRSIIGGSSGIVLTSTTGGNTWTSETSGITTNINGVSFPSQNIGFAVGSSGVILKTTNGGTSWTALTSGVTVDLFSVFFVNTNLGFVCGDESTILTTADGGDTWTTQDSGMLITGPLRSVYFINTTNGFICGDASGAGTGTILRTTDGGDTWTEVLTGANNLNSVFFTDSDTGISVGTSGFVTITTDGGDTWTTQTEFTTNNLLSLYFIDSNIGYSCGQNGSIFITTNGGTAWTAQTSGVTTALNSVFFTDSNNGFSVGNSGVVLVTIDGGTAWTAQTSGVTTALNSIYVIINDASQTSGVPGISYTEFLADSEIRPFAVKCTIISSSSAGQLDNPISIITRELTGGRKDKIIAIGLNPYQKQTDRITNCTNYIFSGYTIIRFTQINANATVQVKLCPAKKYNPTTEWNDHYYLPRLPDPTITNLFKMPFALADIWYREQGLKICPLGWRDTAFVFTDKKEIIKTCDVKTKSIYGLGWLIRMKLKCDLTSPTAKARWVLVSQKTAYQI